VATHTWPDRLGLIAKHFMPLLPLMEGMLPGSPQTYARLTAPDVRSLIHLHHFVDYAIELVARFDAGGAAVLSAQEREELHGYCFDGNAHRRKPLGVWARRGWDTARLLHVDDSTRVVADHRSRAAAGAVLVRHPHSVLFDDVQEWHKVSLPGLWRSRRAAIVGAARQLAESEAAFPAADSLLRQFAGGAGLTRRRLPEGTVIAVHEAPTTAGEFWQHYVEPTQRARRLIRQVSLRHGGRRRMGLA